MTQETAMPSPDSPPSAPQRKPRLALMGEFSAGKSTLTNLLVSRQILPTRVTATRLPPVWISYGDDAAFVVATDGTQTPVALEDLGEIQMESTAMIRLFFPSDALTLCDLIDMPGISDPNMEPEVWQSLMPEVDGVIWCTHATQAWRQSEAAVWDHIAETVTGPNILLVTHFDKLCNDRDRSRVVARVARETGALFDRIFPVSLSQALQAGDDIEAWKASGADRLVEFLVETLLDRPLSTAAAAMATGEQTASDRSPEEIMQAEVFAIGDIRDIAEPEHDDPINPDSAPAEDYVVPRRVKAERRGQRRVDRHPRLATHDE
ncbi:dynamin family protein [Parasedimentitalea psychrophila]|uniref:Dynamin family protein n=1 Tax=Parasedimentitalea psychrophila TaxID=2997337 RepID=A0A9Y2L0R6_9RHOB|nr:dynamin family protein [Parasedimentitalea psychrophila]WIY25855.1 dynamin family protein [Parasedimentitalea psychrophila]